MTPVCDDLKNAARQPDPVDRVDIQTAVHAPRERARMLVRTASAVSSIRSWKICVVDPIEC
jgi:hypothetical protein